MRTGQPNDPESIQWHGRLGMNNRIYLKQLCVAVGHDRMNRLSAVATTKGLSLGEYVRRSIDITLDKDLVSGKKTHLEISRKEMGKREVL